MSERPTILDLDPEAGILDRRRLFSAPAVMTYACVGLAALVVVLAVALYTDEGFMTEPWSLGRIVALLATCLYGGILGWMIFPRRPEF